MKAIIFDMDGVVFDSEQYWEVETLELFRKLVPSWSERKHREVVGLNVHDTFMILEKEGLSMPEELFTRRINELAMDIYRTKAKVMPGFVDLAKRIKEEGIPMGLASSSIHSWIRFALEKNNLEQFFQFITSAEEINGPGKPSPEIYLLAAKKMGFNPKECVAVEDSNNGVRAAKAAGLYTIGFRNGTNEDQDHKITDMDLRGFTVENNKAILDLFKR